MIERKRLEVTVSTASSRALARVGESSPAVGGASARRVTRLSQLGDNKEPRPPETTGALVFGVRPPKRQLQYKVELASHERAAIVQHLAECEWLPNRSFFCSVFVAGKHAQSRSLSARRATGDSVTAAKRALVKFAGKSAAATTDNISEVPKGDEIMRNGNGPIVKVRQRRK